MISSIPNELFLQIFGYLPRTDCKVARLVSRRWSALAAESVFSTIYIGPWDKGLRKFNAIASHPILSKLVVELVFDAREYEQNLTQNDYLQLLLCQLRIQLQVNAVIETPSDISQQMLLEHAKEPLPLRNPDSAKLESSFLGLSFVQEGYKRYSERAREQKRWLQDGELTKTLQPAVRQMSRIKSVKFDSFGVEHCLPKDRKLSVNKTTGQGTATTCLAPGLNGSKFFATQLLALIHSLTESELSIERFHLLLDNSIQDQNKETNVEQSISSVLESAELLSIEIGPHFTRKDVAALWKHIKPLKKLEHLELRSICNIESSDTLYWTLIEFFSLIAPSLMLLRRLILFGGVIDFVNLLELLLQHPRLESISLNHVKIIGQSWIIISNGIADGASLTFQSSGIDFKGESDGILASGSVYISEKRISSQPKLT